MAQVAIQSSTQRRAAEFAPLIAADVGGTYARVGLVQVDAQTRRISVEPYRKYACADYSGLAAILRDFVQSLGGGAADHGVIACAGYALDDVVINPNLPWRVELKQIRDELAWQDLRVVNDFTAVAHAIGHIDPAATTLLTPSASQSVTGPTVVVGPGTGLGAAVLIPDGEHTRVLSTEAGQSALAPGTELEIEILRILLRRSTHVKIEAILSGPGLVNLYAALCALNATTPSHSAPAQIAQAALAGRDPTAERALEVFCGWLGSVVGDLALLYGAQGGVYLAGGILPQIKDFLLASRFVERFVNKGPMRPVLERVPVRLIEHGQLGVIGAASWYLSRQLGE